MPASVLEEDRNRVALSVRRLLLLPPEILEETRPGVAWLLREDVDVCFVHHLAHGECPVVVNVGEFVGALAIGGLSLTTLTDEGAVEDREGGVGVDEGGWNSHGREVIKRRREWVEVGQRKGVGRAVFTSAPAVEVSLVDLGGAGRRL